MTGIDAIIAEKIMEWKYLGDTTYQVTDGKYDIRMCEPSQKNTNHIYWSPSTNLKDTFEMEEQIYEKGWAIAYINELLEIVCRDAQVVRSNDWYAFYLLRHATPEQCARAGLKTIGE